jgi:tetratricopeptide (TPR) repeat protein
VQLAELPGALRAAGDFLAGSMRGSGAPAFAAGLILYGLASGFILMFLWTTLTARRLYESVEDRIDRQRAQIKADLFSLPEAEDAGPRRLDPSAARQVGRVADAVETFAQTYGPEHLSPGDYQRLARQLEAADRYRQAFEMQLHAAEADPTNPDPLVNAGAIASTFLRQYDTADRLYGRALEIRPNYAPAMYNLACNTARKGDIGEALLWLERSIAQNPMLARTALEDSRDPSGPFVALKDDPNFRRLIEANVATSPD